MVSIDGKRLVTLIPGDGIGPECVRATQRIIEAAGAAVTWEEHHAGASIFEQGVPSGVPAENIGGGSGTGVAREGGLESDVG